MPSIKLFLIFTKIGAILLGGGYVILPILNSEFVEKRHILSNEELINFFALAQSLPGIIAANISMFIGYKLKGIQGAITALLGIIFVPFLSIVLLASILGKIINNFYIQSSLWGVGIAVIALIMLTVREIWQKSNKNFYFYMIFGLTLLALLVFKLSPIQSIIGFSLFGLVYKKIREEN